MAKVSSVERNLKRQRLVAKYAAKRALLKDIARNKDLPVEERFQAQLKLAALPRNSAETRIRRDTMSFSDPLGDMLTRIRNAIMRNRSSVTTPASNLRGRVLDVLADEGFIRGYEETKDTEGFRAFNIELKYFEGEAVIREIKRISKPGRRVYSSVKTLPQVRNGLGIAILSTPKGVMSDAAARENNVGGEVLCQVS